MKPSEENLQRLRKQVPDDEGYHGVFDDLIEARLMELDPEWMNAMKKEYEASGMSRWYA